MVEVSLSIIDKDQHETLQDPLHVPSGPITRARSKKINEVFVGLIQENWADFKNPNYGPKGKDEFVNIIHACEMS